MNTPSSTGREFTAIFSLHKNTFFFILVTKSKKLKRLTAIHFDLIKHKASNETQVATPEKNNRTF